MISDEALGPAGTVLVDLQPIGRRAQVAPGTTVMAAARAAGVELVAVCGGHGTCGTCRVRLARGVLAPHTAVEDHRLTDAERAAGLRLACQAVVMSDVRIDIPPESLTASQRLQVEGLAGEVAHDPMVVPVDVQITPPSLDDLRADAVRLAAALAEGGIPGAHCPLPILASIPVQLRAQNWTARLAVHRGTTRPEVVALLPAESKLFGLAVDVGTTKLATYLVDLASGQTCARAGAMNPQIGFGEDVISRIAYTITDAGGAHELQSRLVATLNSLVDELCSQVQVQRTQIVDAVVVGNTAMHHLFAGLPVQQLGAAPYVAAVQDPLDLHAAEVGLALAPCATLYLPPNIAGYVGADHVSMLLAGRIGESDRTTLALDIGTNTEISLAYRGELWSCSTASGPAFEGAHIYDGMRAAPGAVERVRYLEGAFQVHTIGDALAVGLCGSGILDAVAEGLQAGIIDSRGALRKTHPLVRRTDCGPGWVLVPAERTGHGRDVLVTRSDVHEIQLAKGAIRAGTELLLAAAGIAAQDVQEVTVAGAFGTYLDLESAIRVGMLLDLPRARFHQVGNAAGQGAQQLLLSRERRARAQAIARQAQYLELTTHADFTPAFMRALSF
jgi:uncharacterized 2Fe-2S/4Fe-4S cluster protein (DUF4445 family)